MKGFMVNVYREVPLTYEEMDIDVAVYLDIKEEKLHVFKFTLDKMADQWFDTILELKGIKHFDSNFVVVGLSKEEFFQKVSNLCFSEEKYQTFGIENDEKVSHLYFETEKQRRRWIKRNVKISKTIEANRSREEQG
jgi:hypothetical protein